MANKFDKAVKNRSSEILDSGKIENINEPIVTSEETTDITSTEENNKFNLDEIIEKTEKNAKNKTYYLENIVIDEVKKMAKKKKISESKLVNDILKHVLDIK